MNKKSLSEADIRSKFITPALVQGGKWHLMTQIREEYFITKGRVTVRGKVVKRGDGRKVDYLLFYKPGIPIAVIEAKDNNHSLGDGMQQALDYAEILDVPFAYSSNGDAFLEHDRTGGALQIEREIPLDRFPSPAELWSRFRAAKGYDAAQNAVTTQDYYDDGSGKTPRYYQLIAINRTIDAIARGENRILLVMATGTGKTYTAFQIIWRLWKSGAKKRILFLVDRNILADQTKNNDFKPFGAAMTKITNRTADKAFEIYLALYQAVSGTEEEQNIYKQFSPAFFDLVVVDECHRGSAAEDAAWRKILEYFHAATQIGLTATPKETREVSNIDYFGQPISTYSLRQGIADGFLAPYKVIRIGIDKDLDGWRPEIGKTDKHGQVIEDREYNELDFDRTLILERRTALVAAKISEFLKATDRFHKTIVFCENIGHAERMRQALVNANPDLAAANAKYVMRITGDNDEGKAQLDNFIDPESTYPVIATTSQLMSTGVDAQTCHLIVLDKRINSMTEFKQIIGRGTRINEDYGKLYFTIMDFKRATALFADPAFDGEPVQIYEPGPDDPPLPPEEMPTGGENLPPHPTTGEPPGAWDDPPAGKPTIYVVDDVEVRVATERVQYLDGDGRLITESLRDYSRRTVSQTYATLDAFLTAWNAAERKQAVVEELAARGVFLDELAEQIGPGYDAFDLICHVAFDRPPRTRRQRVAQVRGRDVFGRYGEQARAVLEALLDKYADAGLRSFESFDILKVDPLSSFGTPMEIIKLFGGKPDYIKALHHLEAELYLEEA
ncbi:Type I site-specific deoxyribonuclease [Desulfobulbus propionicus DSM 2032]|uniref:Type I site-specific deoxyribonuclease n=1 Tax=Desulfobulbus propionicus (strain ATCC 33891 / DSM 2032 / VKM B-1956 / 1pr3) TaxID=577650 RepID=A0A7U3YK22_DESPD|nr:DEAD/DEAH box helicase family protein [Desulfobulbus propionicus]ADW16829.1 Type I site-specific deoxyribonuclease [Desulfobulbus propionicus DSM 2032]